MAAVAVAALERLRPRVGVYVHVAGADYAVWLLDPGVVRVTDNTCLHVGGPLAEGLVEDGCVVCPWHGWTYDLATGRRQTAIGEVEGIRSYPAWIDGDQVWADLPSGAPPGGPPGLAC